MKTVSLVLTGFLLGVVVACGGPSTTAAADNGDITQAQMTAAIQAAVAPLQTQLVTIQGELPHNLIVSHGAAMGVRTFAILSPTAAPNAVTVATFTATFLGSPTGSVIGMTQQLGMSSTNYLFISDADGATNDSAGLPVTILYEGGNCTGIPFTILGAGISQANVKQGIVFGTGPTGDTVAADYLMLKAGTAPQPDFANSELEAIPNAPTCVNISPGPNNYAAAYPLVQNDQAISGVPSGPFASTTLGP